MALAAAAAAGLLALYVFKGGGFKKDILCMVMFLGCICMWKITKCSWWIPVAELPLLIAHFCGEFGVWVAWLAFAVFWLFPLRVRCGRWYGTKLFALSLFFAGVNLLMVQDGLLLLPELGRMSALLMGLNLLCYIGAYCALYAFCGNWKASVLTVLLAVSVLAAVNMQIYYFRGSELKLADFLSIGTAVQIAGKYPPRITADLVRVWAFTGICALYIGMRIKIDRPQTRRLRLGAAASAIVCVLLVLCGRGQVLPNNYHLAGSMYNGFLLNLVSNRFQLEKPEGYDSFDFSQTERRYSSDKEADIPADAPNIVVVMNESFADLRDLGEGLRTDVPVYAFFDSLTENTVRGHALVSVLGGNTANSEYEFFTGNTMTFLPDGVVSYHQYVNQDTFALPAYLRDLGYDTVAMHPHSGQNWSRASVWKHLGFEEQFFIESFPNEKTIRGYVSDEEVYDKVLHTLQNSAADAPVFLFALTMQNHGGYSDKDYKSTVSLEGLSGSYPEVEQYLSLIRESDAALEGLIKGLGEMERDTILLFFGDHFPVLSEAFLRELNCFGEDPAIQQKVYEVPCFLWANYDIPESSMEITSLNYMGIDLLELAGVPLPSYFSFLKDVRQAVPALNPLGYYSVSQQRYMSWEEPIQGQKSILDAYSILTYNSIKGGQNRSSIFDHPRS